MKTKLLLLAGLCIGLLSISCEKDNSDEPVNGLLSADPTELVFEAKDNAPQTITVTSEHVKWDAKVNNSGQEWITIDYNENSITVSVSDNSLQEKRSGIITISANSEQVKPVNISVEQAPCAIPLKNEALISYYGENYLFNTNGTGEWLLEFITEESDSEIGWLDFGTSGYWNANISNGRRINIYLYCDLSQDFFNPEITEGEYTAVGEIESIAPMRMLLSNYYLGTDWPQGSYVVDYADWMSTYTDITDGRVTLKRNGSDYNIHMNLTLKNGSSIAYDFSGEMYLSLLGTPPYYSNLTDDLTIDNDELAQCAITSVYENYMDPEILNWNIQLLSEGMTADTNGQVSGDGKMVNLFLFTAAASGMEIIPDATYDIRIDSEYGALENTALIGSYNPLMNNSGCFVEIHEGDDVDFAPLSSGSITTKHLGDNNYQITVDGMDDNSHRITITYEGYVSRVTK